MSKNEAMKRMLQGLVAAKIDSRPGARSLLLGKPRPAPRMCMEMQQEEPLCDCGNDACYPEDNPKRCQNCYDAWLEDPDERIYEERDL
jgi:hypothetical protein